MAALIWNHFHRRVYSPVFLTILLLAGFLSVAESFSREKSSGTSLNFAHSHNDYEHPRPLLDALSAGFASVEADIHLVGGRLLVAHDLHETSPSRTLEALYLNPLKQICEANGGFINSPGQTFWLMIDIKSAAGPTFSQLHTVLSKYQSILTVFDGNHGEFGPVSVVISGNRDFGAISNALPPLASIDARVTDFCRMGAFSEPSWKGTPSTAWASDNWTTHFSWDGNGPIGSDESQLLSRICSEASKLGVVLRFWNTPDNPLVWNTLKDHGVGLVNTDRLLHFANTFSGID